MKKKKHMLSRIRRRRRETTTTTTTTATRRTAVGPHARPPPPSLEVGAVATLSARLRARGVVVVRAPPVSRGSSCRHSGRSVVPTTINNNNNIIISSSATPTDIYLAGVQTRDGTAQSARHRSHKYDSAGSTASFVADGDRRHTAAVGRLRRNGRIRTQRPLAARRTTARVLRDHRGPFERVCPRDADGERPSQFSVLES